ncbi:YcaO-like family protein [Microbacterium aurugineum]
MSTDDHLSGLREYLVDLDTGAILSGDAKALGIGAAEIIAKQMITENGRVLPATSTHRRDAFAAALLSDWLGCFGSAIPPGLYEWRDDTHEARWSSVRLSRPEAYESRDDPRLSERPTVPGTARIGPPPDMTAVRRELFDPRLGAVTNIFKDLSSSTIALVGVEFRYAGTVVTSFGRGATFEEAERVALLEMVERRTLHSVKGQITRARYDPKAADQLDPYTLLGFQVPAESTPDRVAYSHDDQIFWIRAWDHRAEVPIWVPLQAVELGTIGEPRYLFETSNGAALGTSLSEARLFAFMELLERDAFLAFWTARVRLDRFEPASLPNDVQSLIADSLEAGRRIDVFNLTFELPVAVALCLVRDDKGPVHTYVSTSAHVVPSIAARLAVQEAIVGHDIYVTNPTIRDTPFPAEADVFEMFDHVRRAASRDFSSTYDFLDDGDTVDFANWEATFPDWGSSNAGMILDAIISALPADAPVYFVDATTDVAYRHGLYVAKTVAPYLLPMTFGHRHRRIDQQRVTDALQRSSYASKATRSEEARRRDDDPHPFP